MNSYQAPLPPFEDANEVPAAWTPIHESHFIELMRFPRAKAFRERGCPEYEKLATIFGDTVAAGNLGASHEHEFNSTDGEDDTNVEMPESIPCTPHPTTPFDDDHTENVTAIDEQEENINGSSRCRSRTPCGSTRRGRRESKGSELKEELKILAETSRAKLELKTKYTISECLEILDAMGSDQVGRDTYIRAMKLFQEIGWRETFIRMTDERRKDLIGSIERGIL
ncbi:hypothetical protein BVC80_1817g18 [Macleaya cordata]|uniref:Myb/SANT-like domain n=1 Tax=Macleaya cordata TaxID=56857 RepID=A0A200QW54_MACCD|nr:hypothetical protein BVC80_1817g18 [Macleaya cordata]